MSVKGGHGHAGGAGGGHSPAEQLSPFAANAHGEEIREIGEKPSESWQGEFTHLLKRLNLILDKGGDKGHAASGGSLAHPLVIAAVITAVVTAFGGVMGKYFQESSAKNEIALKHSESRNQQANELYKQRLDFVALFGDSFPRALNALYVSRKTLLWMKCYPASYYSDLDPDTGLQLAKDALEKGEQPPEAASKKFDEQSKEYSEASQVRLQEKKPTALCVQAIALFGGQEREAIKVLLKTVRELQDVCDNPKPPDRFEKLSFRTRDANLERFHDSANAQFAIVLETLGSTLNAPTESKANEHK